MKKLNNFGFTTFELLLIFVIACILGSVVLSRYGEVRQNGRDEQRKTDTTTLQTSIDGYKAAYDKYPSLAQINDAAFRKTYLKSLTISHLQDPRWSKSNRLCTASAQAILLDSLQPAKGCYGYAVSPSGCDNNTVACTSYTLTANLESSQSYIKQSTD